MQIVRQRRGLILIVIGIVAAVIAAVWLIGRPSPAKSVEETPVVFVRDSQLMLKPEKEQSLTELSGLLPQKDLNAAESWEKTNFMNKFFRLNEQRDKMFFVTEVSEDNEATLYYRDMAKNPSSWKGKPGVELASGITATSPMLNQTFFKISGDGETVLYLKDASEKNGGTLYMNNLREEIAVDERVAAYYYADEPDLIYYTAYDENNRLNLKTAKRSKPTENKEIAADVLGVHSIDPDTGEIHYLKMTTIDGNHELYSALPNKSPVKLVSDIGFTVGGIKHGSFFYLTYTPSNLKLSDIVDDDLAEADRALLEPKREDYTAVERRKLNNYWTGKPYEADVEVFDQAGFDAANEKYKEKKERDGMRRELQATDYEPLSSLYYFNQGKSVKLADNYEALLYADAESGTIIYRSADYASVPKVPMSEATFANGVIAQYKGNVVKAAATYISNAHITHFKMGEEAGASFTQAALSEDGDKVYGIEKDRSLVAFDLEEGKPVRREVLDKDVFLMQRIAGDKPRLFYYKQSEGNANYSVLYEYADGASRQISDNVSYNKNKYYPETDSVYYFTDYDSATRTGTLNHYQGGKSVKIAEDVNEFYYNESSGLYYIGNYDRKRGTGDLMRAGGGKSEQVADRVRFMYEGADYNLL